MLGFTPFRYYYYMWKYVTPLLLLALLTASTIQLSKNPPSYRAWIQELVGPFVDMSLYNSAEWMMHNSNSGLRHLVFE